MYARKVRFRADVRACASTDCRALSLTGRAKVPNTKTSGGPATIAALRRVSDETGARRDSGDAGLGRALGAGNVVILRASSRRKTRRNHEVGRLTPYFRSQSFARRYVMRRIAASEPETPQLHGS